MRWDFLFNMALGRFVVPDKFAGKSLFDIQKEGGNVGRADILAGFLGIDPNTKFRSGQSFNIGDIPGVNPSGSSELQFINKSFTPGGVFDQQQRQSFQDEQRARTDEFTGRLQGIPDSLRAVEQELGIPQAREGFQAAGEQSRFVANQLRDLPGVQAQATRGFDVNANQLARIVAQKTQDLQPSAESATRGLEESGASLRGLLDAFQTRSSGVIKPFEIEAGVLGESVAQEFGLFKQQMSDDLNRELEQVRQQGAMDIAQLQRLTALANIEADRGELKNLGDRVGYFVDGKEVSSSLIGLAPKRAGVGDGVGDGDPFKFLNKRSVALTPQSGAGLAPLSSFPSFQGAGGFSSGQGRIEALRAAGLVE